MLKLQCGRCETKLKVPDSYGGSKVRCPQCNRILRVPVVDTTTKDTPANWAEYLKASKPAVFTAVLIILFGIFWLLSELKILPPVHWLWTLGLAAAGAATLILGGINKQTLVVGPYLIICAMFSILRHMKAIPLNIEIPSLVISFGVLLFIVIVFGYTQPDLLEDEE